MKEKILNSSKYKRFKYYFIFMSLCYLFALIFMEGIIFISSLDSSNIVPPFVYLIPLIGFSVFLLPIALYYGITMLIMVKNIKNYELVIGKISSIYTPHYVRDSRELTIEVQELGKIFDAKVYKGTVT